MAKTVALDDNSTRTMDMEVSHRLLLKKDVVFEGQNDKYKIYAKNRIGSGGESQVYLAERVSDGEQVVAKIYDEYADTPLSRRNRKRLINFLTENSDYKKTHIMPLLDYGTISMESDDGEDFSKPIDIIPYCKDGELKHCNYKKLKNKAIPQILQALNTLHSANLVHRDIKPNNIYTLNGEIVVADFGTSGEISSNDKFDYIGTQKKRGTVGYTAPEVWQGYAVVASDYFSFGCTIATLYKGEHVYQNLINDDAKISRAMKKGLPLECPDTETDLQALVNSLVWANENLRAGYDDVLLWVNDSQSFVNKWEGKLNHEDEDLPFAFSFEGKICKNETELTDAILNKWEDAKRYLYRKHFVGFFQQRNATLADKTVDIVESKETALNENLGLARFLHYLNTTDKTAKCPIYWCGKTYEKLSDISTAISDKKADKDNITAMLIDKFLSWKLSNTKENVNDDTLKAIKEVEDITATYPQLGYYTFMYRFATNTEKRSQTSDEIFKEITKKDIDWYKTAKELVNDDMFLANLVHLGYKNNVLAFKRENTGKFISDDNNSSLMLFYQLFEGICKDKVKIREHFLKYGPQAYLYWFQQNLSLYSFNSGEAKKKEKQIKNVKLDKEMSMDDISRSLLSLQEFLTDFMQLFQNNYLLTALGLRTDKETEGITTTNSHAFFAGDFYGINVPIGYLKTIGT
ncbi:MAG: protein kinase [Treponema sp.]|jgi:serine/threonine protein kinase|nr:protein kinase [Treponema sp.]